MATFRRLLTPGATWFFSQRTHIPMRTSQDGVRARRRELGLWQRRFWEHQMRDHEGFARHADYLHWNPVKHGYVERVVDWPHSSFHRFVRNGLYAADWGGTVDDPGQYGE